MMGDDSCRSCGAPFQYHCPSCNAIIKPGEPQCGSCGENLTWPFQDELGSGKGDGSDREVKERKSWLAPLLGLVLVLIVVGGAVLFLMKLPQSPAPSIPVDNSSPAPTSQISVTDNTPPVISNIAVDNTSLTSVEISWTTDEPSTSQVLWNPKGEYATSTPEKEALVTQHTVDLVNLTPKTVYYFKVRSVDQARNEAISEQKVFGIGVDLGKTQVVVVNSSMSVEDQPPAGTRTYIKGQISNNGNLGVQTKDIQVPILITVAGNPRSEILAILDTTSQEMNPGDSINFSAIVPNETDPNYSVSVRIIGQ